MTKFATLMAVAFGMAMSGGAVAQDYHPYEYEYQYEVVPFDSTRPDRIPVVRHRVQRPLMIHEQIQLNQRRQLADLPAAPTVAPGSGWRNIQSILGCCYGRPGEENAWR